MAGAVAGLSGGVYSGNEAGASAVHRELGVHDARINVLNEDIKEIKQDVRDVHDELGDFRENINSKLDSIESLIRENSREE